jgi:hypothetical protein
MNKKTAMILKLIFVLIFMLASSCSSESQTDVIREDLFRNFRLTHAMWNNMGKPIEYRQWHDDSFKKTGDIVYQTHFFSGEERTALMIKYLLIPNAPFMSRVKGDIYIIGPDGKPEKIGQRAYLTLDLPDEGKRTLEMEKSIHTRGKWIGYAKGKIFEYDDKTITLIGKMEYKKMTIASGQTVNILMTKGIEEGDAWEGELADTTYRQTSEGKAAPVKKLEFKTVESAGKKTTILLMAQDIKKGKGWKGVIDGKVIPKE